MADPPQEKRAEVDVAPSFDALALRLRCEMRRWYRELVERQDGTAFEAVSYIALMNSYSSQVAGLAQMPNSELEVFETILAMVEQSLPPASLRWRHRAYGPRRDNKSRLYDRLDDAFAVAIARLYQTHGPSTAHVVALDIASDRDRARAGGVIGFCTRSLQLLHEINVRNLAPLIA